MFLIFYLTGVEFFLCLPFS